LAAERRVDQALGAIDVVEGERSKLSGPDAEPGK
jgi:hypothetical protein